MLLQEVAHEPATGDHVQPLRPGVIQCLLHDGGGDPPAAQGLRNKQIAQDLEISEGTVKIHLHNIYEKVNVDSRVELALLARSKGFV